MPRCVTEEFTLAVPADWVDRSMITWVAPAVGKRVVSPNILVSKDRLKAGETLDTFVNRQLTELLTKVRNFELIRRDATEFGGIPAVVVEFSMNPHGVPLHQRQIFFMSGLVPDQVSTVVATAAKADFAGLEPVFRSILESVSWNR